MVMFARTALLAGLATLIGTANASAQEVIGQSEFTRNCAVCHGMDGKGGGPIVDFLKSAPADLTQISARNGGRFPFQAVFDTIADVEGTRAHGTSEMPIWGDRFNLAVIASEGEYGNGAGGVPSARARILELVFFLASIQE